MEIEVAGKPLVEMLSEEMIGMRPERLCARLVPGEAAPAYARAVIRPLGTRLGTERFLSLELVASELVTNAVRHAGARGRAPIGFEVECGLHSVRVSVTDAGAGFDPTAPRPAPSERGGWGLEVIDTLADAWWVEHDGGTRVTAELSI